MSRVDSNRHCSDTDISSTQGSEGDLDFGLALDARPTTVVGGKVMQRGGPDIAGAIDFQSFLQDLVRVTNFVCCIAPAGAEACSIRRELNTLGVTHALCVQATPAEGQSASLRTVKQQHYAAHACRHVHVLACELSPGRKGFPGQALYVREFPMQF